ncbi:MAG: phosphoglycerate kinase [Betaproteobacteria bacterium]
MKYGMNTLDDFDVRDKTVLCRLDLNSPLDPRTGEPRDVSRLERCARTVAELADRRARVVLLTHQGGDLEYKNYGTTEPHARIMGRLLGRPVAFVDDVCGPAAREAIKRLKSGEILLLDNVRFLAEELTLFETKLRLSPAEQAKTLVVRKLAPLADLYVCDAFAAVHRSQPTLVGFEEVLPSAMGRLFEEEVTALGRIRENPEHPCVFVLGGAKIEDAFLIMGAVLKAGTCDEVLTGGLVANVMLVAKGVRLGQPSEEFLVKNALDQYIQPAREILDDFGDRVVLPVDFAMANPGRSEIGLADLPADDLIVDLGHRTVQLYAERLARARTVFVNGPAGIFERPEAEYGTKTLWETIAYSQAFSVVGGGDSLAAVAKYGLGKSFSYLSTAGGGLVRYLSGEELPVIAALRRAAQRRAGQQ